MALPEIGTEIQGGILGGYISTNQDGVATHGLIVAPAAEITGTFQWKDTSDETVGTDSLIDGPSNFSAMDTATHPIAAEVEATMNTAAVGGFSDWYIPAVAELDILYQELKPTTGNNETSTAIDNPWAVPKRVAADRTTTSPAQTTVAEFQAGGAEAFVSTDTASPSDFTASSTQREVFGNKGQAEVIEFRDGNNPASDKQNAFNVRAVRRVTVEALEGSAGPTTPEQIFNATYANASAAPPKRTALVRPLDVQRSIDTDVSWLAGNPKEWTVDVIIPVDELQHYRPGNVFFVRADIPGLRAGRKALLKGFAARDIRPTEFVTCIFTAPSET